MKDKPEWLEVGQPVALVSGYNHDSISILRVKRFTPTRVVLENDDWFPLNGLFKRSPGSYSFRKELKDPNDPYVVRKLRLQQAKSLAFELDKAVHLLKENSPDGDFAKAAALANRLSSRLAP